MTVYLVAAEGRAMGEGTEKAFNDLKGKNFSVLSAFSVAKDLTIRTIFKGDYVKKASCFTLIACLILFSIMSCGTSSSPASQPGADIIQQYNFHVEGEPTSGSFTMPQQFTDANWGLKEILCQHAGYSLTPYAGETVSFIKYSITEKFYHPNIPDHAGEPLYLWVLAKDQTSICGYLSVREGSDLTPGGFAINDPYIR